LNDIEIDQEKYYIFKNDINLIEISDLVIINDSENTEEIIKSNTNQSIIILNDNYDLNLLKLYSDKKSINIIKGISDSLVMINELLNNLIENKNFEIDNKENLMNFLKFNNLKQNKISLSNKSESLEISYKNNNKDFMKDTLIKNINWIKNAKNGVYIDRTEYVDKLKEETNIVKFLDYEYLILKDLSNLNEFKKRKEEFSNLKGFLEINQKLLNNDYEYKITCKYYNNDFELENFDLGSVYSVAKFLIDKYNLKEYEFTLNDLKNEYYVDNGNDTLNLSFPILENILLPDEAEDTIRDKINFDFFKVDEILLYGKERKCLVIECEEDIHLLDKELLLIVGKLLNEIMINFNFNDILIVFIYVDTNISMNNTESINIRIFDPKINDEIMFSGLGILSSFEFYKNLYENNSTSYLEKKIKLLNGKEYLVSLSNGNTYIDIEYFEENNELD
jgi:hypothetical protein